MDRSGACSPGSWPMTHEYPDPDFAAYVTTYPWVGGDDGSVKPNTAEKYNVDWQGGSPDSSRSDPSAALDSPIEEYIDDYLMLPAERLDPDYQTSDGTITGEDDIMSDEDSIDSTGVPGGFGDLINVQYSTSTSRRRESAVRPLRSRGSGRGRRGGAGRGGKGIPKGPRKAIEPTEEFKALLSQAIIAFIAQRYDEAEQSALQAVAINPEMYEAHNLLSQIHVAKGNFLKALSASFAGAHTRNRDPEVWSRTADLVLNSNGDDRDFYLDRALYCITRVINLDRQNVGARYQRALLRHELGHNGKAATEYEELLKQLPHDTTVLRHLAEVCIELEKPGRALEHYVSSIVHFRELEPDEVSKFTWSDVNIVTELYAFQERFEEGMMQLKSLSRWLLGRGKDTFWEAYDKDDREWDLEDQPRRIMVSDFESEKYDGQSYGCGLPLELRVKLGVFRLKAERRDLEEAINHFEWLDPENSQAGAKLYDYTDLFREAANVLRRLNYFHEALRYYEPLQQVSDYADSSYLFELASCYRAVGLREEAEDCYKQVIDDDTGNHEARMQLAEIRQSSGAIQARYTDSHQGPTTRQHKPGKRMGKSDRKRVPLHSSNIDTTKLPTTSFIRKPPRQPMMEKQQMRDDGEIHSLFLYRQSLTEEARKRDKDCDSEWMATTELLLQDFRDNKVFYPGEKHHRFCGYSKEARAMGSRPKHELDALVARSKSTFERSDGDQLVIPIDYCDIAFETWLDMFLEYALVIAHNGDIESAYGIIASAYHANVFYHSPNLLLLINVCWFTCALIGDDDETLCNIARWFMKEYQYVTDGYRLFSALNRLCNSESSWFNCGPSQKYIMRQLKAVDFSILAEDRRKSLFQERASYSTKTSDGLKLQAGDMDIALLMLYGHILHAGRSYANAVNYYLRALALDPENCMIKLSLALGYMHYALKRQAENRHQIMMQGLALLLEYYDNRRHSSSFSEQQEAEYNVAHAYHLLGLTHLAVPYYERCLSLSQAVQTESLNHPAEDFALEAAVILQGFWAASGNTAKALQVTRKWMML